MVAVTVLNTVPNMVATVHILSWTLLLTLFYAIVLVHVTETGTL